MAGFPRPEAGIVLAHFIIAADVDRSRRFYAGILGGEVLLDGEPTIVALGNSWVIINVGGPPTDDKPAVTLEPPRHRGAEFLTPPADRGAEPRCYMRDPDGHLIEVGQTTKIPARNSSAEAAGSR